MPNGSRGGMAFSADELRVLRRALAHALQSTARSAPLGALGAERAEDVQEYLRLAEAVDEAVREGGRLRAFLLADLARYRAALPGSALGYLAQLREALTAGYTPGPDDLAALRGLRTPRTDGPESERRAALLRHCERLAELSVRARLRALPGGRAPDPSELTGKDGDRNGPGEKPSKPAPRPEPRPGPKRPVPTPGEVFPPRRKPVPHPETRSA